MLFDLSPQQRPLGLTSNLCLAFLGGQLDQHRRLGFFISLTKTAVFYMPALSWEVVKALLRHSLRKLAARS